MLYYYCIRPKCTILPKHLPVGRYKTQATGHCFTDAETTQTLKNANLNLGLMLVQSLMLA